MHLESLLHKLVCTNYQLYVVYLLEFLYRLFPEKPSRAPWVLLPAIYIFLGVWPHEIAKGARWRYLYVPFKGSDGVDCCSFWRKASMHAKYFTLNYSCNWQIVKSVIEIVPNIVVSVLLSYFVVKTIDESYISRLVVPSQKNYNIGIFEFVQKQKQNRFNWVISSIYEIPHKYVSFLRHWSSFYEELKQIPELSMNISTNCNRRLHGLNVWLLEKEGFDSPAKYFNLLLWNHFALQHCIN